MISSTHREKLPWKNDRLGGKPNVWELFASKFLTNSIYNQDGNFSIGISLSAVARVKIKRSILDLPEIYHRSLAYRSVRDLSEDKNPNKK